MILSPSDGRSDQVVKTAGLFVVHSTQPLYSMLFTVHNHECGKPVLWLSAEHHCVQLGSADFTCGQSHSAGFSCLQLHSAVFLPGFNCGKLYPTVFSCLQLRVTTHSCVQMASAVDNYIQLCSAGYSCEHLSAGFSYEELYQLCSAQPWKARYSCV